MQVTGLFAGIGGIELGLNNAGHQANLFCRFGSCKDRVGIPIPEHQNRTRCVSTRFFARLTELLQLVFLVRI